jgi:hypothetical protein
MSLRNNAQYVFGPSMAKFIPKNPDGSIALPYPGKAKVISFSGLGPFDFSGASVPAAVPLTIKINNTEETKTIDISLVGDQAAVTVAELMAAITTAAFTGVTAIVDGRGYGAIENAAGDAEVDYLQVYNEAALLSEFGNGYGSKFITLDTQQTMSLAPVNVDDENIEVIDSNGKKTAIITPGYREGVTASLIDTAVDNELKALLTGGSYDPVSKVFLAPLPDDFRTLMSIEVTNKMYLKDTNQADDYIGVKLTRAFNMSSKEDSTGDGGRTFQTPNFSFTGTPYTEPETSVKVSDSMTKDYTAAEYEALNYKDI